jgi:hypothetical protein
VPNRQNAPKIEAVHEVLVPARSEPESETNIASSYYEHSRPKLDRLLGCVPTGRLNGWSKVLLFISSCCIPFALASCGGSIIVYGTSSGALVASPNKITFGSVPIGQTASTTVSLLNKSTAPVQVAQLNLSGQPFSLVGSGSLPIKIVAGATHTLNVQFNPAALGTATGQLTIASNSSTADTSVINLSGTGTTGASSVTLSALYCSSGAMTGSGTDACTLTLTSAAPGDGLTVNLSSSSSAVTVPSTVTVSANATSAQFTAIVSSVATAQVVTMTANAGGVMKNFTLQLNAAILALSINATGVAFGDVPIGTPATQSITLTSTGTVPVTISSATLMGAGFTLAGPALPDTLNPGRSATLNIEFDPTFLGPVSGRLTVVGNSSANGTMVIGLNGTGTAAPMVAVTPTSASITTRATRQFKASVTGSLDTAVTWMVSGGGCRGTACGAISPSGLYTAPAAVPSSATVTITATSESDPTKSSSAKITIVPPQAAGYSLAWEDTFSTLSLCTTNVLGCNWYAPGGPWAYTSEAAITDSSGAYVNLDWVETQNTSFTNMTTASMSGDSYHAWTYGYFEVSMAFNPAAGNWPAIWMLPLSKIGANSSTDGINYGEIDLFEWQSNTPATFFGSLHVWKNNVSIVSSNDPNGYPTHRDTNFANYNRYGLLWTPAAISWYFNDILMGSVSTDSAPYNTVFRGPQPYFLILSEQAGCNWIYAHDARCPAQVSPLDMQVQWVHIYASPAAQ